jgi:hypothetical protein|tara:strand:- start:218 stop:394 length:177 start_codon:yes stop_codon:yes gene_type:complete
MEENKLILSTILKNHYEWCKKNGRDTTWMKKVGDLSWYKKFKTKKHAINVVKKLSSSK